MTMLASVGIEQRKPEESQPEEDHDVELVAAWDDVDGKELNPQKVAAARAEEIQFYKKGQNGTIPH